MNSCWYCRNFSFIVAIGLIFSIFLSSGVSFATHTSSVELQPEWSPAGENVEYSVNICNDVGSTHDIDEIRIYKSDGYSNLQCEGKAGWELDTVSTKDACQYVASSLNSIAPGSCETFHFSATTPDSGCEWVWWFETRDQTEPQPGSIVYVNDTTSVDDLAPSITKTLEGETYGTCPPSAGQDCWLTQDTTINVDVQEQGNCGMSGLEWCRISYVLDGNDEHEIIYKEFDEDVYSWQYSFNFGEDSVHELNITCKDRAGNVVSDVETFKVDSEAPTTTKVYDKPYYPSDINSGANYPHWITSSSTITLSAEDNGAICAVGVDKIYYRVFRVTNDEVCRSACHPEVYDQYLECGGKGEFQEYSGAFTINEESCHVIEYYSVALLGNREAEDGYRWQCVFVDNTPPAGEKSVGNPQVPCEAIGDDSCDYYVSNQTEIGLSCSDTGDHPVNNNVLCYRITLDGAQDLTSSYCSDYGGSTKTIDGEEWCCYEVGDNKYSFEFMEDSSHNLTFFCMDALGNKGTEDSEIFKVDSRPPVISKGVGEPKIGVCPPTSEQDVCRVRGGAHATEVNVSAQDDASAGCAVNDVKCTFEYSVDDNPFISITECDNQNFCRVRFAESTEHTLKVTCCDALDNCKVDEEKFYVDSEAPTTTKTYDGETYTENNDGNVVRWISSSTRLVLDAVDNPEGTTCASGVNSTHYRVTLMDSNTPCWSNYDCQNAEGNGSFQLWNGTPFIIGEESCHLIEYYSVDEIGNVETIKKQCVFVDNTPPTMDKVIGDPKIEEDNMTYISTTTPITFMCEDTGEHPVGGEVIYYRYAISNDCQNWSEPTQWTEVASGESITLPEESCHLVEYYCTDALQNSNEVESEIDVVDNTPPYMNITVVGPKYGNCGIGEQDKGEFCMIDTASYIHVEAYDQQPHPVDMVSCKWQYYDVDDDEESEVTDEGASFNIILPEEHAYLLRVWCEDGLHNDDEIFGAFIVDKTPPTTELEVGVPYYTNGTSEWVGATTEFTLHAVDLGPHPSGVNSTYYRVTLVDDEYCYNTSMCSDAEGNGSFQLWNGTPFIIGEESCHLIEYYSVDNVNKTANISKRCIFVDTTAPTPLKEVGKPSDMWTPGKNNDPESNFYPEANERCWINDSDALECWQVTMLTPITLGCEDTGEHPAGAEIACFKVSMDGDDVTERYCEEYGGAYNSSGDGFCCMAWEGEMQSFYFLEETEHELEYYCVDRVGNVNRSLLDVEKFKVEGTKLDIPLYKKWNLISVPFVLLNSNIDVVFHDIEDSILAVWKYENGTWYVWTPDDDGPKDFNTIEPGYGYWVLSMNGSAENPVWLTIGGSLFSPATTPPSRKLAKGWNLIGYYGIKWQMYGWDDMWDYCGHGYGYHNRYIYGDKVYCALNSLINTHEGYPKWSSLWTYLNCGNGYTWWIPLNACPYGDRCFDNRMYAGKGYWIELDEEELYAPATTCVWNRDFKCIGGW